MICKALVGEYIVLGGGPLAVCLLEEIDTQTTEQGGGSCRSSE